MQIAMNVRQRMYVPVRGYRLPPCLMYVYDRFFNFQVCVCVCV